MRKTQGSARGQERHGERGVMAVVMGLLVIVFMGFAALGFDLSYVRLARLEMKNATDAAAHAANVILSMTGDEKLARDKAIEIAHAHLVLGKPMKLTEADIVFGVYNFQTASFTGEATPYNSVQIKSQRFSSDTPDGLVNLTFGRALGYTEADVTQTVISAFRNRFFQLEVDITDSYICQINDAADAAVALLDYLKGPAGSTGDWIGLDLFTARATQMTPLKNVKAYYDNPVGEGIHDIWQRDTSTLLSSQTKGIGVCNKLNSPPDYGGSAPACAGSTPYPNHAWLPNCSAGERVVNSYTLYGGTDLGAAIKAGTDKLKAAGQSTDPKILILLTDGAPMICTAIGGGGLCNEGAHNLSNCCSNGLSCGDTYTVGGVNYGGNAYGENPGTSGIGYESCLEAHNMALNAHAQANIAAAAGIDIYTIGFFSDPTGRGATFTKGLARNKGFGITTSDSATLDDWLKSVPAHQPPALVK